MKIQLSKTQWEHIGKVAGWIKTANWVMHVQESYANLEDLEAYDGVYNIAKRLGFNSAQELWDADPLIKGGVDPRDFGLATQEEYDASFEEVKSKPYTYTINLDERGSFYADVRDPGGNTIFEIKAGNELEPGETSIFEDGFMKHKKDLVGLKQYLVQLGIMKEDQKLVGDGM